MEKDYFISRTGAAKDAAMAIAGIIREAGFTTWLQDEDFGHASFMARMAQGYSGSKKLIVVLSQGYQDSEHCKAEYEYFLTDDPRNLNENVIVLRVDDVAPVEHLKPLAYTNLVPVMNNVEELGRVVRGAIGVGGSDPQSEPLFVPAGPVVDRKISAQRDFTGRESELDAIDGLFGRVGNDGGVVALTNDEAMVAAVQGLGGVGKSVIAMQYAWTRRDNYQGVWWVRSETEATRQEDLISLGVHIIPGIREHPDPEGAVRLVLDSVERLGSQASAKPWLLVYDNVEDSGAIEGVVPRVGADVLITSRWQDWEGVAESVPVETFPLDVAVGYLLEDVRGETKESAKKLAESLGCLPLALNHARSYCRKARCSFDSYGERLSELITKAPRNAAYLDSVYATFDLAIEEAVSVCAGAERLMGVIAFYAPDGIPRSLLMDPEGSETDSEEAISALADVSLLVDSPGEDAVDTMNVHRMVQVVALGRVGSERSEVIVECVKRINGLWPGENEGGNPVNWPLCSQLLPHALSVFDNFNDEVDENESLVSMLSLISLHLDSRGQYRRSEPLDRKRLTICERAFGEEHPDTATSYDDLAVNLDHQGQYDEAEILYRKGLEIRERVLGEEHPDTATSYNNLASNRKACNQYDEAESLFRKSLRVRESVLGQEDVSTAISYSNLGLLLSDLNRYDEADPLVRKSLKIIRFLQGEYHPHTAQCYNIVAGNMSSQGRHDEAERFFQKGLQIRERVLGEEHPDTATSYATLGSNMDRQSRYEEAEPLYIKAIDILKSVFPDGHPDINRYENSLKLSLEKMGKKQ